MSRQHLNYALLVVLTTVLAVFLYGRIDSGDPLYATWELHDYRIMAAAAPSLTNDIRQPFAFRVLGPYLVGLTPFSVDRGFCIVSTGAAVALAFLFYLFLSHTLVPPSIAAFTTLLFVFNKYLFGFPSWNFYHVNDVLVNILILLAFWMISLEQWGWFGLFLFLGSLAKEPALLLIPTALYYAYEKRFVPDKWFILILACAPAVVGWFVVRLSIHPIAGNDLFEAFHEYSSKAFHLATWLRLVINSTIPVSLLPLVFLTFTRSYFQSRRYALVFVGLVLSSTVFGLNNERLMSPAFIVFYSLIAYILNGIRVSTSNHSLTAWAVAAAIVSSVHHTYARFPLPREWSIIISISAFTLLTIIAYVFMRHMRNASLHVTQDARLTARSS